VGSRVLCTYTEQDFHSITSVRYNSRTRYATGIVFGCCHSHQNRSLLGYKLDRWLICLNVRSKGSCSHCRTFNGLRNSVEHHHPKCVAVCLMARPVTTAASARPPIVAPTVGSPQSRLTSRTLSPTSGTLKLMASGAG
jgi:hypothetical protein